MSASQGFNKLSYSDHWFTLDHENVSWFVPVVGVGVMITLSHPGVHPPDHSILCKIVDRTLLNPASIDPLHTLVSQNFCF